MAEGLGQAREGLEGELTCPLCLGIYEDPRTLPCGHIYCKSPCLAGLARANNNTSIICPECRGVAAIQNGNVDALPTAFHINRLKDLHKKFESTTESKTCKIHKTQELAIYCHTCKQILCRDCIIDCSEHQHHDHQYFDKAAEKQRAVLLKMVEQTRPLQESLSQAAVKVSDTKSEISRQQDMLKNDIDNTIDSAVQRLTEQKQNLHSRLESTMSRKLTSVRTQEQELSTVLSKFLEAISAIENASRNLSHREFVFEMNDLKIEFDKSLAEAQRISLSPVSSADACVYSPSPESVDIVYKQFHLCAGNLANPCKCTFEKDGILNAQMKQVMSVVVHVCDSRGVKCVEEQNVIIEILYLRDLSMCTINTTRLEAGCYQFKFIPRNRGRHMISIKVNDAHVMGSPMNMFVRIPPQKLDHPVAVIPDLKEPAGIACLQEEVMLLVCERYANQISMFDRTFQKAGNLIQGLHGPVELTTDSSSNLYVGTGNNGIGILKLNSKGHELAAKSNRESQLKFSNGKCIFGDKLLVVDTDSHNIKIFNKELKLCKVIGKKGSKLGNFEGPIDVDCDKNGYIYVTDFCNNRVQVLAFDGVPIRAFGSIGRGDGQLNCPVDLKIVDQYVFVTENPNNRVSVFTTSGDFVTTFGHNYLSQPDGIAIDLDGFVYVVSHSNRIFVF